MTDQEIEALHHHNAAQVNQMDEAAAGVVSSLLDELKRSGRNTYIKLKNPTPDGHRVEYDFVEGNATLIPRLGPILGFKRVTDSVLEVRSG